MPKLLWATVNCLLDRTSGASISARQQLHALADQGFDIRILGATVFDNVAGVEALGDSWRSIGRAQQRITTAQDGSLKHELLVTRSTQRACLLAGEEEAWFYKYRSLLQSFRPDIVYYYGGMPLDFLIADEAKRAGAKVAFYLVNGNYQKNDRWHRDVDLVITDSQATANLYKQRLDGKIEPLGTFIDRAQIVASEHHPERVLFVNPTFAKGGAIVARLAILMERRRPDILFEIVESRGQWAEVLEHAFRRHREPVRDLANVRITSTTQDMRDVYSRARVLLAPSLWWESGSRVIVEALMNGIPAIVTTSGGSPEMQGGAGFQISMPKSLQRFPYRGLPTDQALEPIMQDIEKMFTDDEGYQNLSRQALEIAGQNHDLATNAAKLARTMRGLIERLS